MSDGGGLMRRAGGTVRFVQGMMEMNERARMGLIAAGVAFFGMFSIFPALAALIAIFGIVADPVVVESQISLIEELIPAEAYSLIGDQITRLLSAQTGTLGWATAVSIGVALWSARAGVAALIQGLNAVHHRPNRGGLWHYAVALLLTLILVGVAILALLAIVVAPILLAYVPLPQFTATMLEAIRWVVALAVPVFGLGLIYRFGPNRRLTDGIAEGYPARRAWITPGSIFVVVVWILASTLFSWYLSNFASYNEVYGSIGAVIAMLMWLYISAYLVLIGAAINVVLDRDKHTARVTGRPEERRAPSRAPVAILDQGSGDGF